MVEDLVAELQRGLPMRVEQPRQIALAMLAELVGAVTVARALDDRELAEELLNAARASLGSWQSS